MNHFTLEPTFSSWLSSEMCIAVAMPCLISCKPLKWLVSCKRIGDAPLLHSTDLAFLFLRSQFLAAGVRLAHYYRSKGTM